MKRLIAPIARADDRSAPAALAAGPNSYVKVPRSGGWASSVKVYGSVGTGCKKGLAGDPVLEGIQGRDQEKLRRNSAIYAKGAATQRQVLEARDDRCDHHSKE